jgi:hypothetical protein
MHHHENGAWDTLWGLPALPFGRTPLALPFPVTRLRAGNAAYSMRHAHVEYYEDARGNQFNWGLTGNTMLLFLDERDDRRILFADPWLPPDYSHQVCGPARSSVRLASVAASASVVFALAKDGTAYTQFTDYDADGGTPFYFYTYAETPEPQPPGSDKESETSVRALPLDDWTKQPPILAAGAEAGATAARVSRRIAIVQNGKGNAARELRVVGDSPAGERGVYVKQLRDPAWRFTPAAIDVGDDEWIDPRTNARAPSPAFALGGWLRTADGSERDVYVHTEDFWFHCSPFHLSLVLDGHDVSLTAHGVDVWSLFPSEDPAIDGTTYKKLKVTLTVDDADALPASVREHLSVLFAGRLDEPFAFVAVANAKELVLQPIGYPWNAIRSRFKLVMRAEPHERARTLAPIRPYSALVARMPTQSAAQCAAALEEVRALRGSVVRQRSFGGVMESALPLGLAAIDPLTVVTTTRFTVERMRLLSGFELHIPAVLAAPVVAHDRWLANAAADYENVTRTLEECASR